MSVTMYDRSKVLLENALHNLEKSKLGESVDDAHFDIACFNAQQALEFILKAVLLEYKVPYEREHDILYLSDLIMDKTDFRFEKQTDMEVLATTITSWEEHGRYNSGIRTKEQTVRRVLNIYRSIDAEFVKILAQKKD